MQLATINSAGSSIRIERSVLIDVVPGRGYTNFADDRRAVGYQLRKLTVAASVS